MKLTDLEREGSFALLGPGFGDGRFVLLTALRRVGRDQASPPDETELVFAPFETPGVEAFRFSGRMETVDVELDGGGLAGAPVTLCEDHYPASVARIREAIAAGDVYQVCYTIRVALGVRSGSELMARVCSAGVPPFAAWVRLPDGAELVSGSPELLFEMDGRRVRCEPMKGTARPSDGSRLAASTKDRAELAMITDLVRNDLTPICRPRSVTVACPRRVLPLSYALQTVSEVTGVLEDGIGPLEVLQALHPGGSVTGAPKLAALSIIGELETSPRGAYCGALGLLHGGRARFALLIRTAEKLAAGWCFGVGSGIVFDSDAAAELAELHTKLGALGGMP